MTIPVAAADPELAVDEIEAVVPALSHLSTEMLVEDLEDDARTRVLLRIVKKCAVEDVIRFARLLGWPTMQLKRRRIDGVKLLKLAVAARVEQGEETGLERGFGDDADAAAGDGGDGVGE